jgi:excisionase family DNA binding protein
MDTLPKLLFTVSETCQILVISRTTLWKLVRSRKIKAFRMGRCVRFTRAALEEFLARTEKRADVRPPRKRDTEA